MYNCSQKPQVQYSLTKLTEGLFYHLQYAPLHSISVTQICTRAGITRRTFYRNCTQKEDLILYACDRLIEQLLGGADFTSTDAYAMYLYFFNFWSEHRRFLRCVYEADFYELFEKRFLDVCSVQMRFPLQEDSLRNHPKAHVLRRFNNAFILGGLTRMLYLWAEESFHSTVEEMVRSILFLLPREYWETAEQDYLSTEKGQENLSEAELGVCSACFNEPEPQEAESRQHGGE